MTKLFTSFYYQDDYWRVQQVLNMGVIEGQPLMDAQAWESLKRSSDKAVQNWIDKQMADRSTVLVLVGSNTASRPWVRYEIVKAWNERKKLLGVRIHGLQNSDQKTSSAGADPFANIKLDNGKSLSDYIPLHTPTGMTSIDVHASISKNLATWLSQAPKRN